MVGPVCPGQAFRAVEKTLRLHECRRNPRPVNARTVARLRWLQAICLHDQIKQTELEYRRHFEGEV